MRINDLENRPIREIAGYTQWYKDLQQNIKSLVEETLEYSSSKFARKTDLDRVEDKASKALGKAEAAESGASANRDKIKALE